METSPGPQHAFIRYLHALALQSRGARDLGLICVGVLGEDGAEAWLHADLRSDRVDVRLDTGPAAEAQACLLLGAREATAILTTGGLPAESADVWIQGDGPLISRWIDALTRQVSPLGL